MSIEINDGNWQSVVGQLIDRGLGIVGALPRQSQPGCLEGVPVYAEHFPLIPESEWLDRIKYMTESRLWIGDRWQSNPQADYQNGLGFCWAYSLAQAVMAVRRSQAQPFVQLSPESLAEDVGYANRGNYLDSALKYAASHGLASRATVPQHKIKESQWNEAYRGERKKYIPLEWYDLDGNNVWAQTVSTLLSGFGCYVGYDWWGHAVWLDRLRVGSDGKIQVHTPNSHGPGNDTWISGKKAVPSLGSFVLRSVTWHE
jgi:hypothetical protein